MTVLSYQVEALERDLRAAEQALSEWCNTSVAQERARADQAEARAQAAEERLAEARDVQIEIASRIRRVLYGHPMDAPMRMTLINWIEELESSARDYSPPAEPPRDVEP